MTPWVRIECRLMTELGTKSTHFRRIPKWSLLGARGHRRDAGAGILVANDPKRTSAGISCCSSEVGFSLYQSARLNRYDAVS